MPKTNPLPPWPTLLIALTVLFQQSWVPGFFQDGYLYAALSKNAAEGGHWLVPRLSDNTYPTFFHHTPVVFILQGLFFKVLGTSYTTARLFGGLFTLGTIFLLYRWCQIIHGKKLGHYACFLLITLLPLIKKSRFPNLDTPLMFTTLLAIYFYTRFLEQKIIYWLPVGISFGLALLIKGPLGLLPCFVIFTHQTITCKFSPYLIGSFFLGLAFFSLWPLSLYFTDQFSVFTNYWEFTFNHTIAQGRNQEHYNPFLYLVFLLKYAAPWVVLALWGGRLAIKNNMFLPLIYFITIFIPLSLAKFKYSHYLLPLYPALATLAALPLTQIPSQIEKYLQKSIQFFAPSLALILLIFPLTTTIKRDPELHKAMGVIQALKSPPKTWVIVDGAYSYFPAANFLAFHNNSECLSWNKNQFKKWLVQKDYFPTVFLVKNSYVKNLESQYPILFNKKLLKLIFFKKKNLIFLLPKQFSYEAPLLSF